MGGDCVEGGDIGKTELAKRVLENRDTSVGGAGRVLGRIYCFYNFVDLRGDEGIWGFGQRYPWFLCLG